MRRPARPTFWKINGKPSSTASRRCRPTNRHLLNVRYTSNRGGLDKLAKETGRTNDSLRVTLFRLRESLRHCIQSYLTAKGDVL